MRGARRHCTPQCASAAETFIEALHGWTHAGARAAVGSSRMSWVDVVRRCFDPALTGHRRRLEFRRTSGAPETLTGHLVFGRPIGIVWLRFHFGHLFPLDGFFH
jgi:hypothetical protein